MNIKQVKHYAREAAAVIGVILTTTNAVAWPSSVRATVLAVSGVLLTVEHTLNTISNNKTSKAA